jgi:hypothetical protein
MKEKVAKAWVAALRSGEYRQAHGCLRNDDGEMCCLGVLCDISELGRWQNVGINVYKGLALLGDRVFSSTMGTPPKAVMDWAGMRTPLGEFADIARFGGDTLAKINDLGASFNFIADIIEDNWEQL